MTLNPPDVTVFSAVPFKDLQQIQLCIESGYEVASSLIGSCDFLQVPSAKSRHQDILNFASDFYIDRQCQEGRISFQSAFFFNKAKNCKYLQLENQSAMITFCSVNSPIALPRESIFRRDLAHSTQTTMEEILRGISDIQAPRYFIITHRRIWKNGKYIPSIQIGIPDIEYKKWNNLFGLDRMTRIAVSEGAGEVPKDFLDISLKEELIDSIKSTFA